jgi:RNA polymerase sigma factor (sigma-70 family)
VPVSSQQLQAILSQHASVLEILAARWCDEPQDCVQDGMVRLAVQHPPPDDPLAWMYRVVRNAAISRGRKATARRKHEREAGNRLLSTWFAKEQNSFESADEACLALATLDSESRELVLMRIWGGLKLQQIADATGTSVATVHRRYKMAIERMRQTMETTCPTQTKD